MPRLPLVLASQSPRRAALLRQLGLTFDVRVAQVSEDRHGAAESVASWVQRVAADKAAAVRPECPEAVIIGADTVVAVGREVLGKPRDDAEAAVMLRRLSGRDHHVLTGVAVLSPDGNQLRHCERTAVTFRDLSEDEIAAYVASREPLDKAGSYGIQGRAAAFVRRVDGCYFSVVGLPLARLSTMLATVGIDVSAGWWPPENQRR